MSTNEMTPKVAIYNTPIARDFRKANPRIGLGPCTIPPKPPPIGDKIQALMKLEVENNYIYEKIIEGYSYNAIAVMATKALGRHITQAVIAGKVSKWRQAEARKKNGGCGE